MKNPGRRTFLKVLGGLGAAALLPGCGDDGSAAAGPDAGGPDAGAGGDLCVLDPSLTKGPYWVDEKLNRADVRTDTNNVASPNPRPGLPVQLQIGVYAYAGGACTPLAGAQVDIWHCDATGTYSDTGATAGQNFLRGYQVTNAGGLATFTTVYPGWYTGRAVHIHVKVRLFDAAKNTTTEATTQLFFDDTVTDSVFAAATPYKSRGSRDTRNANDSIYGGHSELLVNLSGDAVAGFTATVALGVAVGTVFTG